MTTLDEIGLHYWTDKSSRHHNYLEFYQHLLLPYRDLPLVFCEIGVAGGESIRMWQDWFCSPEAQIYGVDIQERPLAPFDSRVTILTGDATQPNFIFDLTNRTGPLDIVLDDGSHFSKDQKKTLELLWPNLKSGGIYIVEDCHTSWWYPWTIPDEVSFVHSTKEWIDDLMEVGSDQCGKPTKSQIEEIVFRKSLIVLKKR